MSDDFEDILGEDGVAEESEGAPEVAAAGDDKRVRDLMSKWQKAEARARKAEQALSSSQVSDTSGQDPWLAAARESVIDRVYASDPRYEKYGIERNFFAATQPDVVFGAARELSALLDGVEARARESVASEAGYTPEIGGAASNAPRIDVNALNDDDFETLVRKVKSGQRP